MKNLATQTLACIATENHQAVPVLEKYNLDFCCKGKRTLLQACEEKGIPVENLLAELEGTTMLESNMLPFTEMSAEELISYILIHHHFYVKQSMPRILLHLDKVVNKHADKFPYMTEVKALFTTINQEMTQHMQKEELVLFPRIKELSRLDTKQTSHEASYIGDPINMMEAEHEEAGNILYSIRQLTSNYTPPAEACTTFRVCLAELKEFEEDLHKHVHLENNVLFPLAEGMQLPD
jgi:regulator of cell morphogenesis and NO signaling